MCRFHISGEVSKVSWLTEGMLEEASGFKKKKSKFHPHITRHNVPFL